MQLALKLMERPKVALVGAGVMLLGIAPVLKWLTQAKVDRFQKVPGIWFFGVYFQVLPFGIHFFEKLAEFSQKYGSEGVYEMENLGERVPTARSGRRSDA